MKASNILLALLFATIVAWASLATPAEIAQKQEDLRYGDHHSGEEMSDADHLKMFKNHHPGHKFHDVYPAPKDGYNYQQHCQGCHEAAEKSLKEKK